MDTGWWVWTGWAVVNLVNLAQAAGFATRERHGLTVNRTLGLGIAVLAVPATMAGLGFARAGDVWWVGPVLFDAFVLLMLSVDYVWPVEFRSPRRLPVLIPYLTSFFGSIVLLGLPMYWVDRRFWLVTVVTSAALLAAMGRALARHVG